MVVDDGLTTHSGCPVLEGTKRIVTQWIRLGVDEENPWDSFDTREYLVCFCVMNYFDIDELIISFVVILVIYVVGVKYSISENQ
jgi:hypothetical protein